MYRRDALGTSWNVPEHRLKIQLSDDTAQVHSDFAGRPHFYVEFNDAHVNMGYVELSVPAALELALALLSRMDPERMHPVIANVCELARAREEVAAKKIEGEQIEVPSVRSDTTSDDDARHGTRLMGELSEWSVDVGEPFALQTFGDSNDELTELVLVVTHPDFAKRIRNVIEPVVRAYKRAVARALEGSDAKKSG